MLRVKILTGSVRPNRFNIQPATWVYELTKRRKNIEVELLDLEKINLPFLDEPLTPSEKQYSKEHTKKWSEIINAADGFIFVTPEYNHSVSPVLKNAIDYLWYEWNYKPVTFVSYGSLAGGSRAVEHWRGIAAELKMYDLREQILLPSYWEHLDESGKYQFSEKQQEAANEMLDSLIFWAEKMKEARKEL
ncbi:MAG: NAD(P)H-dependent oxidoreductase [Candidatus Blackburnbacteria bacterium]|nr:NAD(P)H-dependent oxidoreductase [Candidatus Blackburnbacteria bacterium]